MPSLHVVDTGLLKGFVEVNPRWSGFTTQDYFDAIESICSENEPHDDHVPQVSIGDFDLRGYEVARGQYFHTSTKDIAVTFSRNSIVFSKTAVRKLESPLYVQMLFDPVNKIFAVRPTTKDDRHGVNWAKIYERYCTTKAVRASAFLPTLYEILEWKTENKYRVRGIRQQREKEIVLLFDLRDTEVYIRMRDTEQENIDGGFEVFQKDFTPILRTPATMIGYPPEWADTFGAEWRSHDQQSILSKAGVQQAWELDKPGIPFEREGAIQPSTPE